MTGRMGQTRSSSGAAGRGLVLVLVALVIGVLLLSTVDDDDGGSADAVAAGDGTTTDTTVPSDDTATTDTTDTTVDDGTGSGDAVEEPTAETVVVEPNEATTETTVAGGVIDPGSIINVREAAEVTVIVVNGNTGINGAAGRFNETISPFGYIQADPTNALSEIGTVETSIIYHEAGFAAEAQRLATELGWPIDATTVQVIPNPPPVESLDGANLLVLLGTDRATPAAEAG